MKYRISAHAQEVMHHRGIKLAWVEAVISNPSLVCEVNEHEIHFFGIIAAYGHRCLKVVVNPSKELIVTVYFDRQMRKKGCR